MASTAPIIPIPDRLPTSKPTESPIAQAVTTIGSTPIRASDKQAGSIYVAIRLSNIGVYKNGLTDKTIADVRAALEQTKKITVFSGTYSIGNSNRSYGIGGH